MAEIWPNVSLSKDSFALLLLISYTLSKKWEKRETSNLNRVDFTLRMP